MAPPDPLADVHQGFLVECDDLLEIIHDGLIAIEGHVSSRDTINDMFRAVHSIKGGAGAFNYAGIVRFAHGVETALEGYVPQGRRLFSELTVAENIEIGMMAYGEGPNTRD